MSYRKYDQKCQKAFTYFAKIIIVLVVICIAALLIYGGLHLFKLIQPHEKSIVLAGTPVVYAADADVEPIVEENVEKTEVDALPVESTENGEDIISNETEPFTVILDAGHGGNDGGTFNGEIIEKNIDFSVVNHMKTLLEAEDVEVILTREKDRYMSLEDRVHLANGTTADLYVSIHCNYFEEDSAVSGLECYYWEESDIGEECAEYLIDVLKENKEIKVRSAKESDYFVLKYTDIPAILVEMGFLSNPQECKKLASSEYQAMLAEEMVKGIVDILNMELSER